MSKLLEDREGLIIPKKLFKVAVAQYSSINFDLEGSLNKLEKITKEAANKGVQLLLFPEAFLPGYPHGGDFGAVYGNHGLSGRKIYQLWHESAVEIPGPAITRLSKVAKENNIFLVVGTIEKETTSSTLYCTVVFIKEDGEYLGKHRKLVPTNIERITWGQGDGSTLNVYDSPVGKVGAVICWENYMPLLRTTMYTKGIQIYCAPNADNSADRWQHTMRHIAMEGRCFVLGCNQFTRRSDYPADPEFPNAISDKDGDRVLSSGGSIIVNPLGELLAGPNYSNEELLIADIDLNEVIRGKYDLDVVGHYNRPDIFTLYVNEKPNPVLVTKMQDLKVSGAVNSEQTESQNVTKK
ncbi:unnamed protein product [Orchesella dallaii]|uniref:CN hydrolase domain-containing protein n=1 Tax=Orchesella dallaii TaxID=48710 RepID=A0ABP1S410_9HEXA